MIGTAYDQADLRDPLRIRQRVFLVDGNKQQITAINDHARARGLKVPVLIDFIHVSGLSTGPDSLSSMSSTILPFTLCHRC